MRELKLKYVISLVSDIASKAKSDEIALVNAQKAIRKAFEESTGEAKLFGKALLDSAQIARSASYERQAQYLAKLALRFIDVRKAAEGANAQMAKMTTAGGTAVAVGAGIGVTVKPFVKAYADIEQATTDLKISVMEAGSKLPKEFEAISKIATDLGNKLPGSVKDYMEAATKLASNGVSPSAIANGGLTSAAYLGVLLKMDRADAAETVAKIKEGYKLRDEELPGLADMVQKAKFAFGLSPQGIKTAASYSGATLGLLGLRGADSLSRILTVEGLAQQNGIGDSQFGTNFAEMLTHLSTGPALIAEAKKGMKGRSREIMEKGGFNFEFFDPKTHELKTVDGDPIKGVFKELEKLNELQKKDRESALVVAHALFGERGVRPAMVMAELGVKGYEEARSRQENQATLDERIAEASKTLAWEFDALGGTVTNLMGLIGKQTGELIKPVVHKANELAGGPLTDFLTDRPDVGTAGLLAGGSVGASVAARFASWALPKVGLGAVGEVIGLPILAAAAPYLAAAGTGWAAGSLIGSFAYKAIPEPIQDAIGFLGAATVGDLPGAQSDPPSEAQAQIWAAQMRGGYRGKGYNDPRLLMYSAPGSSFDTNSAGVPSAARTAAQSRLTVDVNVHDDRVTATTRVTQPSSMLRIDGGNTNPAGYGGTR